MVLFRVFLFLHLNQIFFLNTHAIITMMLARCRIDVRGRVASCSKVLVGGGGVGWRGLSTAATEQVKLSASTTYRGRKRFYKEALPISFGKDGFGVELDGRPLRTPHGKRLVVESHALAEALAYEWAKQKTDLQPAGMPLMTLTCSAIDVTGNFREEIIEELLRFLTTDTVLFFEDPADAEAGLVELQEELWKPLLEWIAALHGDLDTRHILSKPQHPLETVASVRAKLETLSTFHLTAVESLASCCKSLIIPLALQAGQIDAKTAVKASRVEEEHQIAAWGLVEGGHDVDRAHVTAQVAAAAIFLKTSNP